MLVAGFRASLLVSMLIKKASQTRRVKREG
jgi:hypothetical protein